MLGAIAGDIIGSVYEGNPLKTSQFPLFSRGCRFTDDTVLTVAVARAAMEGSSYLETVREIGRRYPAAGYGGSFIRWLFSEHAEPYNSWGNGSAMRVSALGWVWEDPLRILEEAEKSAAITHNHPEGIKGAQAVALSVFLARTVRDRGTIRRQIAAQFGYELSRTLSRIRPEYSFDVSCQGSVPESIIAFLESGSYEEAVRNAVSLGGDSDTQAAIAGGIAEAYYGGVPGFILKETRACLPDDLWETVRVFYRRFQLPSAELVAQL